jgi:tetratricopeptide (TPR) repeat protein
VARYRAFISYSHRDRAVTAWLHRALEGYRLPGKLVGAATALGPAPSRLTPIFRDRDELPASGNLGRELNAALADSLFLVVVCSPASARSQWVDQEVLTFKRLGGEDRILALIVAGEPNTADDECFPPSLRFQLGPDGELSNCAAHPIAADLRPDGDGKRMATLKLVAGLTGVALDQLVQREAQRRYRRLAATAVAGFSGMALTGALALYANARRIEADRESATARATSDYLVATFALANPTTENPRAVTAYTILERSAERARTELAGQPVVQARLIGTLGQAYVNLGLYPQAEEAVERSMPAILNAGPDGAPALVSLADSLAGQGRFDEAMRITARVHAMLADRPKGWENLEARSAVIEGMAWRDKGDPVRSLRAFGRALTLYTSLRHLDERRIAAVLENRGLLLIDDKQFAAAEVSLSRSLAIFRRLDGDDHLSTGQAWFALAKCALSRGDLPLASARMDKALAIERRILDADNPILADALTVRGQILQGEGRLPQAEQALAEAVAIYKKRFGKPHFMIGITEVYLALAQADRREFRAALATMDDAKHNYDVSYGKLHPNHGDLLVNRATVLARAGRLAEARQDCAEGLSILAQTLGPTANYTKTMAATCAALPARGNG